MSSWTVQVLCKGFIGFPHNPRNTGLSLSLFLFSLYFLFHETDQFQDRGLLPFDLPPSTTNSHLDPVAQVSSDSTLGCHRLLSSFPFSRGTLQPKGPLGRFLGDTPPSFTVSLSLFARSKDEVTSFSLNQSLAICYGVKPVCPTGLSLSLWKWNLKPLLLTDLKVHKFESLCTQIWPQYKLDNQNH